ncbi:PAS domain-containing protein [Ramlibacter rhizophilus]|uniref:histidine kinase n=1 Tax=Ramlibacter rhizophilus TaxID=1781167 RepID=A0A4Z0BHJ8_9BURK|nr:PAS domain-containing protein [Ramlibacter rhizophilus]TFY98772.1 PAS domain S-box protein [Ramlibacter rhizophilus]
MSAFPGTFTSPARPATRRPPARLQVIAAGSRHDDREWLCELLEIGMTGDFAVQPVVSGEMALAAVRALAGRPGVLLAASVDDMAAQALLARLGAGAGLPPCPVVVVTEGTGRQQGSALLRAGAQDYIGQAWLSPHGLARAIDNAQVRWSHERQLREHEAHLQRSEAFLRGILDSLPQQVLVLDDQGRIEAVNDSFLRCAGTHPAGLATARPGADYLALCRQAAEAGDDPGAVAVLEGLEKLLDRQLPECLLEYRWQGHGPQPWLMMHARRPYHGRGLIVSWVDISARKQAEEQLRQAQRLMQTIIDGAGALVFAKDLEGRYLMTNQAWQAHFGIDEDRARGITDDAVFDPEMARAVRASDRQVLAHGRRIVVEECGGPRDAPTRWLSSKFPLVDGSGHTYAVCGVSIEITPLRQAQAALQARERELQAVADNTPDVLLRFDRQMRHRFANTAIERLTGHAPAQFLGRTAREIGLPTGVCRRWEVAVEEAFRGGLVQRVNFDVDAPTGRRHLQGRFVPEFDAAGQVAQVLAVLHDETERRRAERSLRRRTRLLVRLAEASRLVHRSLSAEDIARVLTEQARRIIGAGRAETWLAGDFLQGQSLHVVSTAQAAVRQGATPTQAHPHAHRTLAVKHTGHAGQLLGRMQLSDPRDGAFAREDKAVLVQLAAIASSGFENASLYASLREADRRKDHFIATLAHELRNPLAPIRNGLEILRRTGKLVGSPARTRDMMERQLSHLIRLVDDLLDVSRISRGKIELRRETLVLQQVIDSALEACRPALDRSGHVLVLRLPNEPIRVNGDFTRLAQVAINLLNNAGKHTPEGGRILLEAGQDAQGAWMRISDNGCGIPADMLPRVFDLFIQADDALARAQGGLGIGLSLVRQLVELHGGRVSAESDGPGLGSRFTVHLPRVEPGAPGRNPGFASG